MLEIIEARTPPLDMYKRTSKQLGKYMAKYIEYSFTYSSLKTVT